MTGVRLSGTLLFLTVVWVVLWGTFSAANVVSGLVVALAVLSFARQPRLAARNVADSVTVRPFALLRLFVYVLYKLIEANLIIAWEVITPRNRIRTGVVAVPMHTDSALANVTVANIVTLTPGTLTIELEGTPPVLYINVLQLHDIDAVRDDVYRLEQLAVRAVGTRGAREVLRKAQTP